MSIQQVSRAPNSSMQYEPDRPLSAFISVGPVIGLVTDKTARILVETSVDCSVNCYLMDKYGRQHGMQQFFAANRPGVFQFTGLKPKSKYRVSFNVPVPGLVRSRFRTLPQKWNISNNNARVAFAFGNKHAVNRDTVKNKSDLWKDVYKRATRGEIDYLIHMGDNVFMDSDLKSTRTGKRNFKGWADDCKWEAAVAKLEDTNPRYWESVAEEICELFRSAYRQTWTYPTVRHALANVPNLMILDDHEIRDEFGEQTHEYDLHSLDHFLACCAYEVYNEYQRQLFEDYEPSANPMESKKVGQAHHFHCFGTVGFMMLDTRINRVLHAQTDTDASLRLLGSRQWQDIEFALGPKGYFSKCRMLFVITQSPLAFVGEGPSKTFGMKSSQWSNKEHVPEASLLLSHLFDWRAQKVGLREVCILGGNVGEGGFTDIIDLRYLKSSDTRLDRMKQVTSSSIANNKTTLGKSFGHAITRGMVNNLGNHHQFSHSGWFSKMNYAIIDTWAEPDGRYPEMGDAVKFVGRHVKAVRTGRTQTKPVLSWKRKFVTCNGFLNPCGGGCHGKNFGQGTCGYAKRPVLFNEDQQRKSTYYETIAIDAKAV